MQSLERINLLDKFNQVTRGKFNQRASLEIKIRPGENLYLYETDTIDYLYELTGHCATNKMLMRMKLMGMQGDRSHKTPIM